MLREGGRRTLKGVFNGPVYPAGSRVLWRGSGAMLCW